MRYCSSCAINWMKEEINQFMGAFALTTYAVKVYDKVMG